MAKETIIIGLKLKEIRTLRSFSLDDVGKLVGKSRKTIHDYEKGKISISVETLRQILQIYEIKISAFLTEIENEINISE